MRLLNSLFRIFLIVALLVALKWIFVDESVTIRAINLPLQVQYVQGRPLAASRPALIQFWATWSDACLQEIPRLNDIYSQFEPRGLQVVGITSEDEATVSHFLVKQGMQYPIALDTGGRYSTNLHVTAIPRAFLVDRTGKVTWQGHPKELSVTFIEAALR